MKIEISKPYLKKLCQTLAQFKIRHGPFHRYNDIYEIYLYPSSRLTFLLLQLNNSDVKVIQ
jgi:hypothetical protein